MFIAVDDTDSRDGMCTTFLATEIIRELSDMDIIGNPRLVRLNPAVPWKTRGNASLVIRFGKGAGRTKKIGEISGKDVVCFESLSQEPDRKGLLERITRVVTDNREDGSESGLVISETRPDPSLYWAGVRTILPKETAEKELDRISAEVFQVGEGRGIIGAACGMAWVPGDRTYELIAYRHRLKWGTERTVDPASIRRMDSDFPETFNSWEERPQKVTMVPSTPCPVLYGLRSSIEEELPQAARTIISEDMERWIIFETNQGTDDHIIRGAEELVPDRSYLVNGVVNGTARRLAGGHVFIDLDTAYGQLTLGAYEPSKEFRMLFDQLIPGDTVEAMGELRDRPRTLNVEKMHVIGLADLAVKTSNPECPECGRKMKSIGKGQGYRCRGCHTRSDRPIIEKQTRWIVPGWYEPPAAARRHLSKPLKRMDLEQPVDFVNSRML